MTGQVRILITGSREWRDEFTIGRALAEAAGDYGDHLICHDPWHGLAMDWSGFTLVHGAARGADSIAARLAESWGMRVEAHPADWDRYGRSAGHRRNAEMVSRGAVVVLAFPIGRSPGTRGCVAKAEAAGIPVRVHEGTKVRS